MTTKGVIAAGHPETVKAAAAVLDEGGNAFDAVLAATYASCVVEPVLSSLGGGGFLLARPAEKGSPDPVVYDFFTQTPKHRAAEPDFFPIVADFGTVTQEFHIGMASMATPGTPSGLFLIHKELCTLPMTRLVEPAVALARKGFTVNRLQAYLFQVVGPIYMSNPASRAIFASAEDAQDLKREGETMTNPDFADTLEALAREGEALFYHGGIAASIADDCKAGGGALARSDFEGYQVEKRRPLTVGYRGARLYTNPPPSTGGILVAFALELLKKIDVKALGYGSLDLLQRLARVMESTNRARVESGLGELDEGAANTLLEPKFLAAYRAEILGRPRAGRGTTHVSVIDAAGNAASLTLSNGEGAGYIVPGTGMMMNNMLGEEDINPLGFHQWPTDTRLCSMMAPSLLIGEDGASVAALGSGGSNRLRTAILQVLVNLLDFGLPVKDAVDAPRLHFEAGLLNIENGFDGDAVAGLLAGFPETKLWDERNLFFGGVHVARFDASAGEFTGAGDPRRGGAATVV